ncbi:MAG: ABC transporter ATP-binding protein [Hespellia sp.]|nr:ABC transporter ATP-binding protein [Hespellia sp.]
MIRTKDVNKIYKNGFHAVNNLNLKVGYSDIFGFLGPNGAGKTTTIRMLDGLLTPSSGEIKIGGWDIQENPLEIKRMIGVVPESHGYYSWMTAREYLEYFSDLFRNGEKQDDYIQELLENVGLSDRQDSLISQFSRGMKQRLGIAKALVNQPKIIFLDEPTLGLDPNGQREIQQLLKSINQEKRITIFITSHQLKDIEVLCNKVCIVKAGELIEQGSIPQLQEKYMPGYTIEMQTSANLNLLHILQGIPKIERVFLGEEGQIVIVMEKGREENFYTKMKHDIIAQCMSAGIDIETIRKKKLSMEDIFFRATREENQEK